MENRRKVKKRKKKRMQAKRTRLENREDRDFLYSDGGAGQTSGQQHRQHMLEWHALISQPQAGAGRVVRPLQSGRRHCQ